MTLPPAPHGWQLQDNSAEAYERYLVPQMFAPWATQLIERLAPKPNEQVLDVACGTGIVARRTASCVGAQGRIVGFDLSNGMLAVARSFSPELEWRQGNVEEMPFPDNTFDVVLCQQGLQFFADPTAALREMHRVLVPNGRLGVTVWRSLDHNPAYRPMIKALERHVGVEAATMMQSPFPDWNRKELRHLLHGAGFRGLRLHIGAGTMCYPSPAEFLRREAASSPLADLLGKLNAEVQEALVQELQEVLQPFLYDDSVIFPMEAHHAFAYR